MNPGVEFRGALLEMGLSATCFARVLGDLGDPRPLDDRQRWVRRLMSDDPKRLPGELIALVTVLRLSPALLAALPSQIKQPPAPPVAKPKRKRVRRRKAAA